MGRRVARAVERRSARDRELKVYADLTFREISVVTGVPQGTVATRTVRPSRSSPSNGEGVAMNDEIERRLREASPLGAPA